MCQQFTWLVTLIANHSECTAQSVMAPLMALTIFDLTTYIIRYHFNRQVFLNLKHGYEIMGENYEYSE